MKYLQISRTLLVKSKIRLKDESSHIWLTSSNDLAKEEALALLVVSPGCVTD